MEWRCWNRLLAWGISQSRFWEAGFEPDVVEFNGDRRELLELKAQFHAGNDFMELSPRGFTGGDVFRRKDGSLGVMVRQRRNGQRSRRFSSARHERTAGRPQFFVGNRDELEGSRRRQYVRLRPYPDESAFQTGAMPSMCHAYSLLKPGGRIVAMGEGVFGQDKKAGGLPAWLEEVGGTSEKLKRELS